jgi:zinc transport system substrate-binding protein
MMQRSMITIIFAGVFIIASFAFANDKLPVFVSIAPQRYLVQQIGNDLVDVQVMVSPGTDPHTYEPRPQQMVAISKAKLYFAIGIEFEKANLKKIVSTNPKIRIVNMDRGIKKIPMADAGHHGAGQEQRKKGGDKNEDHHHEHGGLDPHIWLSPPLVKIQVRTILTALQEIDPSNQTVYTANYHQFTLRIDKLDAELKTTFAGKQGLKFMVFHPSWGYFAHAYGLKQVPIEIGGKHPKPAQLKELIEHAKEEGINVIFVQPQFSRKSAGLVAKEIGGQLVFVDPLAEDWMANLREVANRFKPALK